MTTDTLTTVVRADHVPGPKQGQWTYADYARLPDDGHRYEVIDGVLYMAPAPIPAHEIVAVLIHARLAVAVIDAGLGMVLGSPDVDLGGITVRPDAVVVLQANIAIILPKLIAGTPDLVVEIASPSTAAHDRDATSGKQGAYARSGVPEYWIADPDAKTVEVLILEDGAYKAVGIASGTDRIPSRVLPGVTIPARDCFPRDRADVISAASR
jgi:Uma2 family endonuclease